MRFFPKSVQRKAFAHSLSFDDPEGQIDAFPNFFAVLGI